MTEERKSAAAQARSIVRRGDKATLATLMGTAGDPYTSLVMVACDQSGAPLMLLSDLAQHTRNIVRDPRASLAFDATDGHENPLSRPRLSLLGRIEATDDAALIGRYLRRHEVAADYLALGGFGLFRLAVERAHLVAGFGAIHWLTPAEITPAAASALAAAEEEIIEGIDADHAGALARHAGAEAGGPGRWRITGVDPEGFDLAGPGGRLRGDFGTPVDGSTAARERLVKIARDSAPG